MEEKADFLYFEVEAPNGINLIMFRDGSVTFSTKIRKENKKNKVHFLVINLLMLQNRGYSALNELSQFSIELRTKHVFSKNENK